MTDTATGFLGGGGCEYQRHLEQFAPAEIRADQITSRVEVRNVPGRINLPGRV
jgi:hypothetical protein